MFRGGLGNAVLAPVSEVLSRLVVQLARTAIAAKDVLIEQESFMELSQYLERVRPILDELLSKAVRDDGPPLLAALESLEREVRVADKLVESCSKHSRIYLLYRCRRIVKDLQDVTNEIGRCLGLIPITTLNISIAAREHLSSLALQMRAARFAAAVAEEQIVDQIDEGIRMRQVDSTFVNGLLVRIAQSVGAHTDPAALQQELLAFKKEKEDALLLKNQAEAMQLEQIIAFLSLADDAKTAHDREISYHSVCSHHRNGSNQTLAPLRSFYCPITQQVMDDPVEIASGKTFERCAIEQHFAEGNQTCPVTKTQLTSLEMKPNLSLRSLIQEWRERNVVISLGKAGGKLKSENDEEVEAALMELYKLTEEKAIRRDWIRAESLIPIIVQLLTRNKGTIRKIALETLCSLAIASKENKKVIVDAGAVSLAVRSLARNVSEGQSAVQLLLELASKDPIVCEEVGKAQSCILLLVMMLSSKDRKAADDAQELLNYLSSNDQNVVQMAEANYFKPLLQRLCEGSDKTQLVMATALSRMGLTDHSKASLGQDGAIPPLVKMISTGTKQAKSAALGTLCSLSTVPDNRDSMINAGIVPHLLQLLSSVTSTAMDLKEQAAATLANLATSAISGVDSSASSGIVISEDTLYCLLSLLNLPGPKIQGHLLEALYGVLSPREAMELRTSMREGGAIQLLFPFTESDNINVRSTAVKILFCLSEDGCGGEVASYLNETYAGVLVGLLSSVREDERVAVAGIISNLPASDRVATEVLRRANVLPVLVGMFDVRGLANAARNLVIESAAGALLRFTIPTELDSQREVASLGAIPLLVEALVAGSAIAKSRVATNLAQLSESTMRHGLSWPIQESLSQCGCFGFLLGSPAINRCRVHGGRCSVKASFCLVEADAVGALIEVLNECGSGADEAALAALVTLLEDSIWERGAEVIVQALGIPPLIKLLREGMPEAVEKAVWMLERIFRIQTYADEYGNRAQMELIDLTQHGMSSTKRLAATTLAHLNIIHNQSTYF